MKTRISKMRGVYQVVDVDCGDLVFTEKTTLSAARSAAKALGKCEIAQDRNTGEFCVVDDAESGEDRIVSTSMERGAAAAVVRRRTTGHRAA